MNIISITGRLTTKPEQRTTQNGVTVCSFTCAVKRPHSKDVVDFIDCVAWRQSAEYITKYAEKGDSVGVSGSLQSRKWKDKDGNNRTSWEVQCDSVEILSAKKQSEASDQYQYDDMTEVSGSDELPF